ncbi:hypothetical protein G6F65_021297 [Rhizopus arrhizus]|nr:hypothetical protein G6F65_021297 [Rhizopus arrhizus]
MQGKAAAQGLVGVDVGLEPGQAQPHNPGPTGTRNANPTPALDHGSIESRGVDMTHAEHLEDLSRIEAGIGHGAQSRDQPWPADTTTSAGRKVRSAMA